MRLLYKLSMMLVFVLLIFLAMTYIETSVKLAYSQLALNPQIWKDSEDNVKILFSYSPDNPVMFDGLSNNEGNYFISYAFPDLGTYQVIMRTKSSDPNFATLASFSVTVALETSLSNIAIISIIVAMVVAVTATVVVKLRYR